MAVSGVANRREARGGCCCGCNSGDYVDNDGEQRRQTRMRMRMDVHGQQVAQKTLRDDAVVVDTTTGEVEVDVRADADADELW